MDNYNNYIPVAKAVNTGGVSLVDTNSTRTALTLYNQGDESAQIYMDVTAAYIDLLPKQGMTFNKAPINEVHARTSTGTTTITVMEA